MISSERAPPLGELTDNVDAIENGIIFYKREHFTSRKRRP